MNLTNATALADLHPMQSGSNASAPLLADHDRDTREQIRTWMREAIANDLGGIRPYFSAADVTAPSDDVMRNRYAGRTHSIPALMAYLRDTQIGPWAVTTTAAPVPGELDFTAIRALLRQRGDAGEWVIESGNQQAFTDLVTPGAFEGLRPEWNAFTLTGGFSFNDLLRNVINRDIGPVNITLPTFLMWVADRRPAAAVPQGNTGLDWEVLASRGGVAYREVTAEQIAPYEADVRRWYAEVGADAAHLPMEDDHPGERGHNTIRGFLEGPANYPDTMPAFAGWMLTQQATTVPQGNTPVSVPSVEQFLALSADGWRRYQADIAAFLPQSRMPGWARNAERARGNAESIIGARFDYLSRDADRGVLYQFAVAVNNGSYTLLANRATEQAGPSLPTSPHDAFPTWEEAETAARTWAMDSDPRLPNELAIDGSYTRRGDGNMSSYAREMRAAWDADRFDLTTDQPADPRQTPLAAGFWRDVRDLGYGTPYWTASAKNRETITMPEGQTAMPIGPTHPGWNAWWEELNRARGGRYQAEFDRLASAMGYNPPTPPRVYQVTFTVALPPEAQTRESVLTYLRDHPQVIPTTRAMYLDRV